MGSLFFPPPGDRGHSEAAPLRSDRRSAPLRSASAAAAAAGQTMDALSAQARIINTDSMGDRCTPFLIPRHGIGLFFFLFFHMLDYGAF